MMASELEMKMRRGRRQFAEPAVVRSFGLVVPTQLARVKRDTVDRLYQAGRPFARLRQDAQQAGASVIPVTARLPFLLLLQDGG